MKIFPPRMHARHKLFYFLSNDCIFIKKYLHKC
jgi:hypothetical protein